MPNMLPVKRNFYQADFSFMSGIDKKVKESYCKIASLKKIITDASENNPTQEEIDSLFNRIILTKASIDLLKSARNNLLEERCKEIVYLTGKMTRHIEINWANQERNAKQREIERLNEVIDRMQSQLGECDKNKSKILHHLMNAPLRLVSHTLSRNNG
jgi:vacuolar-type H+-ATPase subunit I/STV1